MSRRNEPVHEKTNNLGSDTKQPVVTEEGQKLEILDLRRRGIVLLVEQKQRRDQLHSYCKADLRLCFCLCKLLVFPCGGSNFNVSRFCLYRIRM